MGLRQGSANRANTRVRPKVWMLLVILLATLLVSGCVRSDLAIEFRGQSGGQIVEHIRLADQVTAISGTTAKGWFEQIEQRAKQLRGKTKRLSNQEIEVVIPFGNGADLEAKLNQFLNPPPPAATGKTANPPTLPLIQSQLDVRQQNFLLVMRNRLRYELDLRSLGVQSPNGEVLLSPNSLFELTFKLQTPWGARRLDAFPANVTQAGNTLTWTPQPGELNHLETAFWYPSALGIGAVLISLLALGGFYLKYRVLSPPLVDAPQSKPVTSTN